MKNELTEIKKEVVDVAEIVNHFVNEFKELTINHNISSEMIEQILNEVKNTLYKSAIQFKA